MIVSENYKKLRDDQIDVVSTVLADAWQNPELPARQYESVVRDELNAYRNGKPSDPFDALKAILVQIRGFNRPETTLLDVGAASGYYSEVLKIIGFQCQYTAVDFSTYFKDLAGQLFPELDFRIGNATELPFDDKSFDVILHGACLMHVKNYPKAIQEAVRVAKRYVIFHRTPIYTDGTRTECWMKTAYGVSSIEWHFNEIALLLAFQEAGLILRGSKAVFADGEFGHTSYLLEVA